MTKLTNEATVKVSLTRREILELMTNLDIYIEEFSEHHDKEYKEFLKDLSSKMFIAFTSFNDIPF